MIKSWNLNISGRRHLNHPKEYNYKKELKEKKENKTKKNKAILNKRIFEFSGKMLLPLSG